MPSQRPTLHDLAREAGLSSATVDRVINTRHGVHPRTRKVVLTAARRLGYLPEGTTEAPARLLRFTFLLPAGTNHFMEALQRQIEAQAAERPGP